MLAPSPAHELLEDLPPVLQHCQPPISKYYRSIARLGTFNSRSSVYNTATRDAEALDYWGPRIRSIGHAG